jgi:hypothetical protein
MQTIVTEIAKTFVDDATAFMRGCGRMIIQIPMAPIDRLANACDVAGVLQPRRTSLPGGHAEVNRARPGSKITGSRRRRARWRRLFAFDLLGDLT